MSALCLTPAGLLLMSALGATIAPPTVVTADDLALILPRLSVRAHDLGEPVCQAGASAERLCCSVEGCLHLGHAPTPARPSPGNGCTCSPGRPAPSSCCG